MLSFARGPYQGLLCRPIMLRCPQWVTQALAVPSILYTSLLQQTVCLLVLRGRLLRERGLADMAALLYKCSDQRSSRGPLLRLCDSVATSATLARLTRLARPDPMPPGVPSADNSAATWPLAN